VGQEFSFVALRTFPLSSREIQQFCPYHCFQDVQKRKVVSVLPPAAKALLGLFCHGTKFVFATHPQEFWQLKPRNVVSWWQTDRHSIFIWCLPACSCDAHLVFLLTVAPLLVLARPSKRSCSDHPIVTVAVVSPIRLNMQKVPPKTLCPTGRHLFYFSVQCFVLNSAVHSTTKL